MEPTPEQVELHQEWLSNLPPHTRAVAERFEPWSLYRLKTTGMRVIPVSFEEEEDRSITLTVFVGGTYNHVAFERSVFGIKPDELEPCELPPPDEILGSLLSLGEVEENIDTLRVNVRPDLWKLDEHGKAVKR